MLIVSTCLAVDSSKSPLAVAFITSKCIFTSNSIINARVVKTFVDICKIKWENCVRLYPAQNEAEGTIKISSTCLSFTESK